MSWFKFNKLIGVATAFTIIICNILIGRYFAPAGILMTPIVMAICTLIISLNGDKFNSWMHVILVYLLLAINDIGIKLYVGGIHDFEGMGWINMMLFLGLVPATLLLAIGLKASKFVERTPILLFVALITFHL